MKKVAIFLSLFILGVGGSYGVLYYKRSPKASSKVAPGQCEKHKLTKCPFCDKSQVEALGECKAHKVPEALCYICRPELIAAYKIDGDWCGGHKVPESQCQLCGGGPVVRKNGKVLCNKHKVPAESCPFCDKSLIKSMGMCGGHKVPEALCTRCNADLIPGFKAEGDWCAGHNLPESQCLQCGGGAVSKKNGTVLCNKHKVPAKSCPFCDKSLIKSMGMCGGHKVPEALCTRCNADLIPGFKAEGDWCAGHNLPESQCKQCGAGQ